MKKLSAVDLSYWRYRVDYGWSPIPHTLLSLLSAFDVCIERRIWPKVFSFSDGLLNVIFYGGNDVSIVEVPQIESSNCRCFNDVFVHRFKI